MPGAPGDVAFGEHGDAGDRDRAELQAGGKRDLPFGDAGQHHDDPVPLHDAARREPVREAVARSRDVVEREPALVALRVAPDEGELRRIARPGVDHVGAEVERVGGVEPVPGHRALVVLHSVGGHPRLRWRLARRLRTSGAPGSLSKAHRTPGRGRDSAMITDDRSSVQASLQQFPPSPKTSHEPRRSNAQAAGWPRNPGHSIEFGALAEIAGVAQIRSTRRRPWRRPR